MAAEIANQMERFGRDIQEYSSLVDTVKSKTSSLFDHVNALSSTWEGTAHDVFMAQFSKDVENMNTVIKNLQTIGSDLENARNEYNRCESNVQDIISAIQI